MVPTSFLSWYLSSLVPAPISKPLCSALQLFKVLHGKTQIERTWLDFRNCSNSERFFCQDSMTVAQKLIKKIGQRVPLHLDLML